MDNIGKCEILKFDEIYDTTISYELDKLNKSITIIDMYYEKKHINIFFLLLKKSINKFIDDGYKTFIHCIDKKEYDDYLSGNKNWKIVYVTDDNNYYYVSCQIERALEYIAKGLGITEYN